MKKLLFLINGFAVTVLAIVVALPAGAQNPTFQTGVELAQHKVKDCRWVGRRDYYWLVPNPSSQNRIGFRKEPTYAADHDRSSWLFPTSIVRLQLLKEIRESGYTSAGWVELKFDDDSIAYGSREEFFSRLNRTSVECVDQETAEVEVRGTSLRSTLISTLKLMLIGPPDSLDVILGVDPAELRAGIARFDAAMARETVIAENQVARDNAKSTFAAKKAADIRRAKGGVSVGMTNAQVLASNWGKPESINRTTFASGEHEQWVYAGFQYLYFEDGVVTAIQSH